MEEIRLSTIEFTVKMRNLRYKAGGIASVPAAVEEGETNVSAMKKLVELYGQLGEMMQEYKELLARDQETLEKAGNAMMLQDSSLAKLWR